MLETHIAPYLQSLQPVKNFLKDAEIFKVMFSRPLKTKGVFMIGKTVFANRLTDTLK
jgi:hypothetical protein